MQDISSAPSLDVAATGAATARGSRPFVTLGTRAALAAPLVALFAVIVGAPLYADELSAAGSTGRFALAAGATLLVFLLLTLGLQALHVAHERRMSGAGHAAFVVALAGTLLAAGGAWESMFSVPYLAEQAPAALDRGSDGSLLAGFLVSYAVLAVGWVAVGNVLRRAGVKPRSTSVLLMAGAVLAVLPAPTALRVLPLSVAVALAARVLARDDRG